MSISGDDQSTYKQKMSEMIDHGFAAISMAMGWRLGLFRILLEAKEALTPADLASQAKLKERYVREWLGCMVTTGVLEMDAAGDRYQVSPERRQVLKSMQEMVGFLSCAISRFESIENCFRLDGPAGKSFGSTEEFLDIISRREVMATDDTINNDFLKSIPELKEKLESGIEVGEFGSNAGVMLSTLAQRFPNSHFRGSDISSAAVKEANERVQSLGLKNISFHLVDLCRLPESWKAAFDWVYVRDVVHDLPHPEEGVKGLRQSLREGGICSVIDINAGTHHRDNAGKPGMGMLYTMSTFFCIPNALDQDANSIALGPVWGLEQARELFTRCGFKILYENPSNYNPIFCLYVLQM